MICRKCNSQIQDNSIFCNICGVRQENIRNKRRRGNGQGTVYKYGASWRCEKTFGFDEKGARVYARKSGFKTKTEALAFIPLLKDPRTKKTPREKSTEITLKSLYDLWLPTHKASKSTIGCYTAAFKAFMPVWYNRMQDMDIDDLQECMDEFAPKKGTNGKRTLQNAKTCLGLVYKYGMPRGYVPFNASGESNLAKFLKINTGGTTKAKTGFSSEELETIRNAVGKIPYADYILCNCYLGFRPSAFLMLDAKNYNRQDRSIIGGIKTEAGINRTVTISPKIQPIIDRLTENKISGAIFCDASGDAFTLSDYRSIFYDVLEQIGVDNPINEYGVHRITPHSCRHTFATLLKSIQAPDKDKLELIGHNSEEMLRYYQDVSLNDLRKITDKI